MAFQQVTEDQASKTVAPTKKGINYKDILTALLIISLLGTWGYIIWDKNNTKELVKQKDNTISVTSAQRDELQKELEDATVRYDILKTTNSQKDSLISEKDKEIESKQSKIRSLLSKINASAAELAEAKSLILSLNTDIEGYKKQIEVLEGEKTVLTAEKATITQQRDQIRKDYDSSLEQIKDKENTIDIGSTLKASNFNIIGLDEKKSGKIKETTSAKRVDKLRISFNLDENMIAKSGAKQLYIIITDPTGKVCAQMDMGSGKFSTRDGEVKTYTQKMEVNYVQNKSQTISFDWKGNQKFDIGAYKIEVYNNGFKVGEGIRPLKKGGIFG